jgi:hypothetical protein
MRKTGLTILCAAALSAGFVFSVPASAMSLKACNAEWKQKKDAKETGDQKYADFRKECLGRPAAENTSRSAPAKTAAPADAKPAATTEAAGDAVFPTEINAKYAKESAGLGRRHTCLDQYNENKANNANGGLKWLAKGGYYSQCNTKLKAQKS